MGHPSNEAKSQQFPDSAWLHCWEWY